MRREAKERLAKWCSDNDEEMGKTLSRLMLAFVDADPLVQAYFTRRPDQRIASAYAAALRAMADQLEAEQTPADDNISVLLHPERPEQVLKPKKRKTG